jgi:hypothetical protein
MTAETVALETPARRATSRIVENSKVFLGISHGSNETIQ